MTHRACLTACDRVQFLKITLHNGDDWPIIGNLVQDFGRLTAKGVVSFVRIVDFRAPVKGWTTSYLYAVDCRAILIDNEFFDTLSKAHGIYNL